VSDIVVIGGPNGAGKTTAVRSVIPAQFGIREFVNADEIAEAMAPSQPERSAIAAGRLLVRRIHELAKARESFAFETTCAGRAHAKFLRECRSKGYRVVLLFLWLPSPQAALTRVARRVSEGGHGVLDDVVIRRYHAGLRNLKRLYLPLADMALIYDNSDKGRVLVAETQSAGLTIHDQARWQMIEKAMQ
jgi:predicted ABC-type ATPase